MIEETFSLIILL